MPDTQPMPAIAEVVDLSRLERTLRASIALMRRSRRRQRREASRTEAEALRPAMHG